MVADEQSRFYIPQERMSVACEKFVFVKKK
jgi:hypothetical protein